MDSRSPSGHSGHGWLFGKRGGAGADLYTKNEKENWPMRKETSSRKSSRKSSGSWVAKPRHRTEPSVGERLLNSMKELRAHLLREKLGLSQSDFAALFGFSVRSLQDWEQGRRRPEIPIRAYLAVIQRDPQAVIRALRAA